MIAIPMKKPKNCIECKFTSPPEGECWFVHSPKDCPIIDIVTCGECKYVMKLRSESAAEKFGQLYECRNGIIDPTTPNKFCSYGERRRDESNTERD